MLLGNNLHNDASQIANFANQHSNNPSKLPERIKKWLCITWNVYNDPLFQQTQKLSHGHATFMSAGGFIAFIQIYRAMFGQIGDIIKSNDATSISRLNRYERFEENWKIRKTTRQMSELRYFQHYPTI